MTVAEVSQPTEAPVGAPRVRDHIDVEMFEPFTNGFPHAEIDKLRAAAPVAWAEETTSRHSLMQSAAQFAGWKPGPGFWVVTSHAAVSHVSRTPVTFSSWLGTINLTSGDEMTLTMFRQMLINMDAPEHSRLRRLLQPLFTPRATQRLHDAIVRNATEIAGDIDPGGCDLVTSVSAEMPLRVLADLLGMPREDRHLMFEWSNKTIGIEDPEYGGDLAETMAAISELFAYGKAIADDRRANPRDDVVSLIANAEVDGVRLTDVEFGMFWLLLIIAGNETTRNTLSGSVLALHDQDRWGWLREHPEHLGTAVEELTRHVSPVIHMRRTATHDVELEGQQIRAGDKVVLWYPAANRDPAMFERPHELDLERDPNPHLAFGVGAHFCLGAHLARLQLSTMLGELLRRYESVEVGTVERVHSNFIDGIKHLPVTFRPTA